MTAAEPEPTAIIAIKRSLCEGHWQFCEWQARKLAQRFGYNVLEVIDTDAIPQVGTLVTAWHVDAVITTTEDHIRLDDVTRRCEVITVTPEAAYTRGQYERLH